MMASTIATVLLATRLGAWGWEPSPIVGGEPVVGDDWRSTVVIDLGVDLCSGTLISERVVLTAAHCLQSMPPAELLQVKIGNTRADPELALPVERYALHPEYCANVFECEEDLHDFAVVVLAEAAPADAVVPRLPTDQATWDAAVYTGAPLVLAGFGYDERLVWGIKRAVEVEVRGSTASGLELLAGGNGKDGCQGDSGGPAYGRLPSGEVVLVGVSSRGLACGEGGYFGATPPALCWAGEELGIPWDPDDAGCGGCCVDLRPARAGAEGCAIAGAGSPTRGAWGLLLVAVLWRRRPRHSCRSASIGSSRAARTAG